MKKLLSDKGLLSLEASIVVTLFLFLMLFLYSFFIVFEARNEMAHVLLTTSNSLSLDSYEISKLQSSGNLSQLLTQIYGELNGNSDGFVSNNRWTDMHTYEVDGNAWNGDIFFPATDELEADEYGNAAVYSSTFGNEIKQRFFAYLSGGDNGNVEETLKRLHVKGGKDGLDFTGTHISEGKLYLSLRYTLEYEYKLPGLNDMTFQQSVCSKLW